jgi:hypothetical protein
MFKAKTEDGRMLASGTDYESVALLAAKIIISEEIEDDVIVFDGRAVSEVLILLKDWGKDSSSAVGQRRLGCDDSLGDFTTRFIVKGNDVVPYDNS